MTVHQTIFLNTFKGFPDYRWQCTYHPHEKGFYALAKYFPQSKVDLGLDDIAPNDLPTYLKGFPQSKVDTDDSAA